MHAKQCHLLELYKKTYPKRTLREMARDFGINPSRVFRLLNGQEMKVSEFEKIKEFLNQNKIKDPDLYKLARYCEERLSVNNLNSLMDEMKMFLYCKQPSISFQSLPEGA